MQFIAVEENRFGFEPEITAKKFRSLSAEFTRSDYHIMVRPMKKEKNQMERWFPCNLRNIQVQIISLWLNIILHLFLVLEIQIPMFKLIADKK